MVGIAQLAEHRIVVPGVEGSSPFTHPMIKGIGSNPNPFTYTVGRSVTVTHQTLTLILWVRVPPSQPRQDGRAPLRSRTQAAPVFDDFVSASPSFLSKTKGKLLFLRIIEPYAPVAQQAEHLPFKQGVRGSNPRWSTRKTVIIRWLSFLFFQWIRTHGHQICEAKF